MDSLMILAWNKDLETFSALIESAALDVHAYVSFVNNRAYGDSRVRCPAKGRTSATFAESEEARTTTR
ncbi:MAG: hypothetical protein IPK67_10345 [Planctomycetes bacterium]|nr:hypothetical protein [Planctomycetota bacterium]